MLFFLVDGLWGLDSVRGYSVFGMIWNESRKRQLLENSFSSTVSILGLIGIPFIDGLGYIEWIVQNTWI